MEKVRGKRRGRCGSRRERVGYCRPPPARSSATGATWRRLNPLLDRELDPLLDPALVVPMGEEKRRGLQGWWSRRGDRQRGGGAVLVSPSFSISLPQSLLFSLHAQLRLFPSLLSSTSLLLDATAGSGSRVAAPISSCFWPAAEQLMLETVAAPRLLMRKRGSREVRGEGRERKEERHIPVLRRSSAAWGERIDDDGEDGGRPCVRREQVGAGGLTGVVSLDGFRLPTPPLLPWTSPHPATTSIQLMAEDDGQVPGAAGGEMKMARAAGEIPPCAAASSRPGGARLPALRRKRWQVEVSFLQDNPMPQQEVCTSNLCISPSDSSWLLCFATKLLCLICFKK